MPQADSNDLLLVRWKYEKSEKNLGSSRYCILNRVFKYHEKYLLWGSELKDEAFCSLSNDIYGSQYPYYPRLSIVTNIRVKNNILDKVKDRDERLVYNSSYINIDGVCWNDNTMEIKRLSLISFALTKATPYK